MALHLHHGIDTVELAAGLADVLSEPLADPLAQEVVVVPAKGIERWLTQRLSHHLGRSGRTAAGTDGVCAGVAFVSPASLRSVLTGTHGVRRIDDPWSTERLTWTVLDVVDEHLHEPWLRTVARHLGSEHTGAEAELRIGRRYALARHLAGLFTDYATQRPDLLTAWGRGELVGSEGDLAWQATLWRHVVDAVATAGAHESAAPPSSGAAVTSAVTGLPASAPPDVAHAAVLAALDGPEGARLDLPPRLSLFGHTRLAATEIELLRALSHHRDVHLWLPQASPAAWAALAPVVAAGPISREKDDSVKAVAHPLLASLGRDSRELQRSLAPAATREHTPDEADGGACTIDTTRILGMLQHDIATDTPADAAVRAARGVPGEDDRSIQVHACHGATRQVEILRDVLTGLLEDDPTLQPRDILVMCPDIEDYAPLFQAAFGLGEEVERGRLGGADPHLVHPAHGLRVRLADRSLISTNPLFRVTLDLLDLTMGRVTVSQMLDLAAEPAVSRRFRFDEDALEKIEAWIEDAGIRWGLDGAHRGAYRLGQFEQNTWRAGLDRLLLGVAMAEGLVDVDGQTGRAALAGVLPVDDVGSGDIDLVGRLAEFVDRVWTIIDALGAATHVSAWMAALRTGVASLTSVAGVDAWQSAQLDRELASVAEAARTDADLRLADVRRLLERRLGGRPTRANFRTGTLTVCTMVPMRSVPHRVVALVGLDDGAFPRVESVDGDDVLAREPRTGERDRRSEDRQLLLDAIMAAREHLVITYSGASDVDGSTRPPAVPVGEVLDAVHGVAQGLVVDGASRIVRHHPLQPFDPGLLSATDPFTFDRSALAAARALSADRVAKERFLTGPLGSLDPPGSGAPGDVALADLHRFFANPARAFLRERLDVQPLREEETDLDAMPVELDGLARWGVGDRILSDALAGVHPDQVVLAEAARGLVPPAHLGRRAVDDVLAHVRALMQAAAPVRVGEARVVDLAADLPGGRRVTGSVAGVHGTDVVSVSFSSLSAKSRLRAWIDLLALTVARPDEPWTAHVLARRSRGVTHQVWGPLPPTMAATWLAALVDVRDRGLCEPIPLPPKTSLAYAEAAIRKREGAESMPWQSNSPQDEAGKAWETDRFRAGAFPGENTDPAYATVFGPQAPLRVLLTRPGPDEDWNGEGTRLGRYALHVWEPEIENGRRA